MLELIAKPGHEMMDPWINGSDILVPVERGFPRVFLRVFCLGITDGNVVHCLGEQTCILTTLGHNDMSYKVQLLQMFAYKRTSQQYYASGANSREHEVAVIRFITNKPPFNL